MAYKSIAVSLDLSKASQARTLLARDLAEQFDARLIGIAGRDLGILYANDAFGAADIMRQETEVIRKEIAAIEEQFADATKGRNRVEFRSGVTAADVLLADHARAADLLVVGGGAAAVHKVDSMAADAGTAIMTCGRPVVVAPQGVDHLTARRAVVAWRNTREARRAVFDALPFLKAAELVYVATVEEDSEDEGAADAAAYLREHGVTAVVEKRPAAEISVADELSSICGANHADLIVAGAYGHSRTREWAFGGVTRDLLREGQFCCLMSH